MFADWPALKPKLRAGRAYASARGWRFSILTEREIRTPYLENVRFLLSYRTLVVDAEDVELLQTRLRLLESATPEVLLEACSPDRMRQAQLLPVLWHLVAIGNLEMDLSEPLTMGRLLRATPH